MKKFTIGIFIIAIISGGLWYFTKSSAYEMRFSDSEAEFEGIEIESTPNEETVSPVDPEKSEVISSIEQLIPRGIRGSRWAFYWREFSPEEKEKYENFVRPAGPIHVGIQVGHWKNNEVPSELSGLKRSGSGATGGGKTEVDTVLIIARKVKTILEAKGIIVDLLPATIPVDYIADAFVSIHADGNNNPSVSGFKIASPQRDFSGQSVALLSALNKSYEKETRLDKDSNITRRMSAYYVFNWRRYEHALHPMTPAVIVETGFMTSPEDRTIIIGAPDKAAKGIAQGILIFLQIN